MTVSHTELKRCDLIALHGRIDSSKVPEIEEVLNGLIEQGRFRYVIDFRDVEYISSAFLRVIITTLKTVKRWNRGNIYLAAMPERIHEVFNLAGLLPMFSEFPTVAEAVGEW